MDAKLLRRRVIQLRATIDQGEFAPDDEDQSLLEQVFGDDGDLEDIEEQAPTLFNALIRVEEDYGKVVEATSHLECSMAAVEAMAQLAAIAPEVPDGVDAEAADDGDPDADLEAERN